jgi:hypothetical protein
MRVSAHHLFADPVDDVVEVERRAIRADLRVKHDLQQQIAELVGQRVEVAALDAVGHLVSLLDGIGRNRREVLGQVPGAAARRVAEPRHDFEQSRD